MRIATVAHTLRIAGRLACPAGTRYPSIGSMDDAVLHRAASELAKHLSGKKRILFITGAGLSAESGLPTYRGVGGLYVDRETEHGMPIEEALSGPVFLRRPEVTWGHIAQLERAVRGATFNQAHAIVASLEREHDVVVLTQNVDGFHRAAGSTRVIDIHGDCHELVCTRCAHRERRDTYEGLALPPRCPLCDAVVRPAVVLFEEMLPIDKLEWLGRELTRGFDAYFSIGTSSLFSYITQPMLLGAREGKLTVEINPEPTPISRMVSHRFACGAVRALSAIFPAHAKAPASS